MLCAGGAAGRGSLGPGHVAAAGFFFFFFFLPPGEACDAGLDASCLPAHPATALKSPGAQVPECPPRLKVLTASNFLVPHALLAKFSSSLSLKVFLKHHLPRDGYQALLAESVTLASVVPQSLCFAALTLYTHSLISPTKTYLGIWHGSATV